MEPGWPPSAPGPEEPARGDPLPEARPSEPEDRAPCRRGLPPGASRAAGERLPARYGPPSDTSPAPPLSGDPPAGPEDGARLRAVFDALDGDGDGFVRIEDFVQFATVYGAEQVTGWRGSSGSRGGRVAGGRCILGSQVALRRRHTCYLSWTGDSRRPE